MGRFQGSDFALELPEEYTDESTYAFAFPGRGGFRPSVVVKTERLGGVVALAEYARMALAKLPGLEMVSNEETPYGRRCVYDWGDPERRIRQVQRYLLLANPARVVTLTGTTLRELYPQTEALFEAVFDSYRSLETE